MITCSKQECARKDPLKYKFSSMALQLRQRKEGSAHENHLRSSSPKTTAPPTFHRSSSPKTTTANVPQKLLPHLNDIASESCGVD